MARVIIQLAYTCVVKAAEIIQAVEHILAFLSLPYGPPEHGYELRTHVTYKHHWLWFLFKMEQTETNKQENFATMRYHWLGLIR